MASKTKRDKLRRELERAVGNLEWAAKHVSAVALAFDDAINDQAALGVLTPDHYRKNYEYAVLLMNALLELSEAIARFRSEL